MANTAHKIAFAAQLRLRGEDVAYEKIWNSSRYALRGLRGQTPFREEVTDGRGSRIVRSTDFIFDTEAFWNLVGRWPEDGDTLQVAPPRVIGSLTATVFRVTPFNGEPVYRIEATYSQLRIHTQELRQV